MCRRKYDERRVIGMDKRREVGMDEKKIDLVRIEEVMEILKVKESKVRKMILNIEIKYVKVGNLVRFKVKDIVNYIDINTIEASDKRIHSQKDLIV